MNESYEYVRAALAPQNVDEHATVDHLTAVMAEQLPTLAEMIERRARTARRSARMDLAQRVLARWDVLASAPDGEVDAMEHLASGADLAADELDPLDKLARDQAVGDERRRP